MQASSPRRRTSCRSSPRFQPGADRGPREDPEGPATGGTLSASSSVGLLQPNLGRDEIVEGLAAAYEGGGVAVDQDLGGAGALVVLAGHGEAVGAHGVDRQ